MVLLFGPPECYLHMWVRWKCQFALFLEDYSIPEFESFCLLFLEQNGWEEALGVDDV